MRRLRFLSLAVWLAAAAAVVLSAPAGAQTPAEELERRIRDAETAVDLDVLLRGAAAARLLGDFARAGDLLERATAALTQAENDWVTESVFSALASGGGINGMQRAFREARAHVRLTPQEVASIANNFPALLTGGEFDEMILGFSEDHPDPAHRCACQAEKAWVHRVAGRQHESRILWGELVAAWDRNPLEFANPDAQANWQGQYARNLARAGRTADAMAALEKAMSMPVSDDERPAVQRRWAQTYAELGNVEAAVELLDPLIGNSTLVTVNSLATRYTWEPRSQSYSLPGDACASPVAAPVRWNEGPLAPGTPKRGRRRALVRIGEVGEGSIAEALELRIGTRILKVNGVRVRDSLDFHFLTTGAELELEAEDPDGVPLVCEISRDPSDPSELLGIVPARDKIRECANKCVFCFIDGNPPDARAPLWLRDDDFRLSFTYGSYVTLTNLGPRGLQRLVDQRISPLYVSVHATDPDVRARLLANDRAGLILGQLETLLAGGIAVHTQVVLCPEWNDGAELDRTIRELYMLGDGVLSLSVVPVGLTRYNLGRPVRLLTADEARRAVEQTEAIRARARSERGSHWCYAADELFLMADGDVPAAAYYDDWPLRENGVGAVRTLIDAFEAGKDRLAPIPGVSRVRIVTGASMTPHLHALAAAAAGRMGCSVEVVTVENGYFGPSVTIAGLLSGADIAAALEAGAAAPDEGDLVLLPATALNDDEVFIDGMPLADIERRFAPARVRAGHDLIDALAGGDPAPA